MKDIKKVGLVNRIAAGVCAVLVAVSCLAVSDSYSAKETSFRNVLEFADAVGLRLPDDFVYDSSHYYLISGMSSPYYEFYRIWEFAEPCMAYFTYHGDGYPNGVDIKPINVDKFSLLHDWRLRSDKGTFENFDVSQVSSSFVFPCCSTSPACGVFDIPFFYSDVVIATSSSDSTPLLSGNSIINKGITFKDSGGFYFSDINLDNIGNFGGSYNSSLGYLQNIQRKNLTLDGENYDPDYDSWQVMFSFDSTSTSGLDITTGGYSVRHFMNWEVRDKDSNVIRTYDKVSCGEYDAASCKISYPLYSTRQAAMDECGFEALSWWESGVLGYEVYIYDYLQLVRTNEDGSIEYGGYVRIDGNGYVSDTLDDNFIEDPNGYLDQDIPSSNGSGSNYEDAEHDADKNAGSSSGSSEELLSQINFFTSLIKAVPELIMELFSFLPEWCLDLVATAFSFSVIIFLFKFGK